ncbi:MAG: 50S ribosomal protein L32 [Bacillota bacterium]
MAVPKKKMSKARTGKRRSQWKLELPTIVKCSRCHSFKLPHRVCKECGYYNGKEVITIKD